VAQGAQVWDDLSKACYHEEAGLCPVRTYSPIDPIFRKDAAEPTVFLGLLYQALKDKDI
jgi:hypothetical protein